MTESNKRLKTKRNIEEAMVRLLEKESFDQITTVELAQESGISRSSFYTHYRDKYDMIERYQQALFHKLEYIFDKHQDDKRQAITEVFEFLTKEPLFAVLLTDIERVYSSVYLTNAFFGVCQMWVSRGKKESPQQMAEFLMKMLR